jgi:hypothetical protein
MVRRRAADEEKWSEALPSLVSLTTDDNDRCGITALPQIRVGTDGRVPATQIGSHSPRPQGHSPIGTGAPDTLGGH